MKELPTYKIKIEGTKKGFSEQQLRKLANIHYPGMNVEIEEVTS